jgi:hypothetical protein
VGEKSARQRVVFTKENQWLCANRGMITAVNSPEVNPDNGMLTLASGHSKEDSSRTYK